jgi:hypothetical protein
MKRKLSNLFESSTFTAMLAVSVTFLVSMSLLSLYASFDGLI